MIKNRYFLPNSPCIVNSGKKSGGLAACFVVDFPDSLEGIYKTKLDFALIAKKGGGCGTTLSKLRPEGEKVNGGTHGHAGGPIKFYNTISHDMDAMTQGGFRPMAMMGTMSVYHPDILKFINAKPEENMLANSNISVIVDDNFMERALKYEEYQLTFPVDDPIDCKLYGYLNSGEVLDLIVENAWRNGEPGLLFDGKINNSPYQYSRQKIWATNPCGEEPLPPNGVCNLGSLNVRFLDYVIDVTSYPTEDIKNWALDNRPIGLGIMGLADMYLKMGVTYGTPKSLEILEFILSFIYKIAEDESIKLGEEYEVPWACSYLPVPRRNVTLLSIAPTGTISLLADCSNGIEPIFSEVTVRKDGTGTYNLEHPYAKEPHFRCAVSGDGIQEVTWKEHIDILASAQKFVDAGVSKTINFPQRTRQETIKKAFIYAWETGVIKGLTVYRNGSREKEVLSPKNIKKDKCPLCGEDLVSEGGCKHCESCEFSLCEV
jgi:ribonucleoside-diphosphate reductase alpha chain